MNDRLLGPIPHRALMPNELRLGLGLWLGGGSKGGGSAPPVDAWRSFTITAGDFPSEPDEFQSFELTAGDF